MRLTEKGYSVLVLERGKRFRDQDYPKTNWDIFKFLWLPALRCFGIFEMTLDVNDDPEVMDPSRENMSQLVDTPKRRAFMKKIGERGWLGMTWPKKYGGSEGEGVYEYLLNERLAGAGCPQIGKGVGIIGKTLIRHGSEKLKQEFLPKILQNDIEFAVGYSEPQAGSDAAAMALRGPAAADWMTVVWKPSSDDATRALLLAKA